MLPPPPLEGIASAIDAALIVYGGVETDACTYACCAGAAKLTHKHAKMARAIRVT